MLELRALITGADPRQLSFGLALWTRDMVRELIRRRFRVSVSAVTVGRILKKLGMSPQRPLYRAYQQNPEKVREWKEKTYPAIREEAVRRGALVFFADEAAVRTDFHAGTTWAPVGQTPVVRATGERKSIMMVSAISPRGELRFRIHEGSFRAEHFIEFCKQLMKDAGNDIFLIVDGSPVHTARKTKEFVQSTGGKLNLFFLPGYSPQLNPDEWVWKNVKHDTIGSPYLTGVPPIRPLSSARPDPAGRRYGALATTPVLATVRDRPRRGSLPACRAAQPENRRRVYRCRHSRVRSPHPPPSLAPSRSAARFLAGHPIPARSGTGNQARSVHISTNSPVNYSIWQTKSGSPGILVPAKKQGGLFRRGRQACDEFPVSGAPT